MLTGKLGASIGEDECIVAHTPMRELQAQYADKLVLVVGT
jgi:hypothetical protein